MWTGSSTFVICPSATTDGAATLLSRHIDPEAYRSAETEPCQTADRRLASGISGGAWTSGQWLNERVRDSDVRSIKT